MHFKSDDCNVLHTIYPAQYAGSCSLFVPMIVTIWKKCFLAFENMLSVFFIVYMKYIGAITFRVSLVYNIPFIHYLNKTPAAIYLDSYMSIQISEEH